MVTLFWEEKFKLDVWYVDNSGFFLDMIILIKTLYKVFLDRVTTKDGDPCLSLKALT